MSYMAINKNVPDRFSEMGGDVFIRQKARIIVHNMLTICLLYDIIMHEMRCYAWQRQQPISVWIWK